jgi:hypothetical protein
MRIIVHPPRPSDSPDGLALRACRVLRHSLILSARVDGIINDRAAVLVAPSDGQLALSILKRAGMQAVAE